MKIELKSMLLNNFKGIKNFSITFNHDVTNIYGENGIGKTTFFDAFRWLFFGKDSFDRKDFNIKNTVNLELNRQDHEVSAIAMIDDVHTTFRRVMREKWVKKHGSKDVEFTGHETLFFINDVPFQQGEYTKKIDDMLNESIFKLITDPQYFNRLKWQDRRSILMDMAGTIDSSEVMDKIATLHNKTEILSLTNVLNSGKTIEEYKREISSKKKIISESLKSIPVRIDELLRSLPEAMDYPAILAEIETNRSEIEAIDGSINNRNLSYQEEYKKIQTEQALVHSLATKRNEISFQVKSQIQNSGQVTRLKRQELLDTVETISSDIKSKTSLINSKKSVKDTLLTKTADLRTQWAFVNAKELLFNEHDFACPTCKRDFEAEDIDAKKAELKLNFDQDKAKQLAVINTTGTAYKKEVSDNDELILSLEATITGLTKSLSDAESKLAAFDVLDKEPAQSVDDTLANNDEYISLGAQIAALESKIKEVPNVDISDLKAKKNSITSRIDTLIAQLNTKEQIEKTNARIAELKDEESAQAQKLADLEQIEFTINEFDRARIDTMEARINGKFKYVKFKMFDRQINGGEVETCETLVEGVPYADANNAGRINSGLDIINALCGHYDASAPIFIDNRESIINTISVGSQVINLIVSKGDANLRVA